MNKSATCKGSMALGTACGPCERCKEEKKAKAGTLKVNHHSQLGSVNIEVFENPEAAPIYTTADGYKVAYLKSIAVVKNGTEKGNATIDLVFEDSSGNKFIAMAMGSLTHTLKSLVGELK